jgi:DNA-binding response OmpR family regulator
MKTPIQIALDMVLLTPGESDLVFELLAANGEVVSKHTLADRTGMKSGLIPGDSNSIEVLIGRIRRKIAEAGAPLKLDTVRGRGYSLQLLVGGDA